VQLVQSSTDLQGHPALRVSTPTPVSVKARRKHKYLRYFVRSYLHDVGRDGKLSLLVNGEGRRRCWLTLKLSIPCLGIAPSSRSSGVNCVKIISVCNLFSWVSWPCKWNAWTLCLFSYEPSLVDLPVTSTTSACGYSSTPSLCDSTYGDGISLANASIGHKFLASL